jgi:hypothetical protein
MRRRLPFLVALATIGVLGSRPAFAGDGGTPAIACATDNDCKEALDAPHCAGGTCVGCVDYAGNPCAPVACDGALCDTTTGSGCAAASGRPLGDLLLLASIAAVALWRRRRRTLAAGALLAALLTTAGVARAENETTVDVVVHEPPVPQRRFSVAWNPLPLLFGKVSFDVVFLPKDHHGLLLTPFFASASTAAVYAFDDHGAPRQLPEQTFTGAGLEIGYRYYFGRSGPRGLFFGPSLLLGGFAATAQNGDQTHYLHYGLAVDVGYQILIDDRISLLLGGGIQGATASTSIPPQQFPAKLYANFGVYPRVLASIGVAF